MNENFNYCYVVGKTDVGRKRVANEDSMCNAVTQNGLVSVVCDGMGGHVGGATASRIAVSTIIDNLNNTYYDDPRVAIGESIDRANSAIIQKGMEQPELSGMGSTCVLLLVRDGKVYIGHVGDSRIYLVRSKKIIQLTKDHSYVQMLVDCGEITKEEAEHHPRKNEITNALGIPNMSPATVAEDAIVPEAGDCFVLCSDGLSGMVSDDTICKVISRQSEMNAQERVDRLVSLANENGGLDNITAQLVEFSVSPSSAAKARRKTPVLWAGITCSVLMVLAALGFGWYLLKTPTPTPGTGEGTDKEIGDTATTAQEEMSWLDSIPFEKNGEIVELEFKEKSLELRRGGKRIHEVNHSCELESLKVCTLQVKISSTNLSSSRTLSFKEERPAGDSVFFCVSQSGGSKTYKFVFSLKPDKVSSGKAGTKTIPDNSKDNKSGAKKTETPKEPAEPKPIKFEYDTLKKDTTLLILDYSGKPILKLGNDQKPIGGKSCTVSVEKLTYDKDLWEYKEDKKGKKLSFSLKETPEKPKDFHFEIPCALDGKEVVVSVNLVSKKAE